MALRVLALFAYGSLIASCRSWCVVAQRSGLKGHVDDQVVVLWLHEEDGVHRARYPARGRCAPERDDAEVISPLAFRLRSNTGLLALYCGIKDCGRRVHMSATTWQRKHAASRTATALTGD